MTSGKQARRARQKAGRAQRVREVAGPPCAIDDWHREMEGESPHLKPAAARALWLSVLRTFVACDFWCHTHGRWVQGNDRSSDDANERCSDACEKVPVYMPAEGKARPDLRDGSDYVLEDDEPYP